MVGDGQAGGVEQQEQKAEAKGWGVRSGERRSSELESALTFFSASKTRPVGVVLSPGRLGQPPDHRPSVGRHGDLQVF